MGFWHTGYMEFHEPLGLEGFTGPPPDTVFICEKCQAEFGSLIQLQLHRFEKHPSIRPVLLLRGREVGSVTKTLSRPLSRTEIVIEHARTARLNGTPIDLADLSHTLTSKPPTTADIVLEGDGTIASFHLRFDYALADDILGVEQCFIAAARRGRLDRRSIEEFITACKQFPTAEAYCDGICEYLFGVLAKERHSETILRFDDYRLKFNRSADILGDIERGLAHTIVGLVCFHFNYFALAARYSPSSRVGIASLRLQRWLTSDDADARQPVIDSNLDAALTDRDSETLLRFATLPMSQLSRHESDLLAIARPSSAEYDQTKAHMLLVNFYRHLGKRDAAISHARELLGRPAFREWAQSIIKTESPSS